MLKPALMARAATAAILIAALAPGLAHAAGKKGKDVGAGLVGNTVELAGPQGTTRIYYPDRRAIVVRAPDGSEMKGHWRVKGRQICTRMAKQAENCTAPIDVPPVAGSSGTLPGEAGGADLQWSVRKGKGF